jgi:hypothetical protein
LRKGVHPSVFEEKLLARLSQPSEPREFLERAAVLLEVARAHEEIRKAVAGRILELVPEGDDKESKGLRRSARRAMGK